MSDFDFDQSAGEAIAPPRAYAELSCHEQRRVDELVRRIRRRQMDGQATTAPDLIGFTQFELGKLLPVARQRMHGFTFRQDHFETALSEEIDRETAGGDIPDERAVEIAVAAASGLVPSDAQIATHLLQIGLPSKVLGRIWPRVKARLGAHTAATTRMPEVA